MFIELQSIQSNQRAIKKSQMYYQYISSFGDMSNYQLLHVDVFKLLSMQDTKLRELRNVKSLKNNHITIVIWL